MSDLDDELDEEFEDGWESEVGGELAPDAELALEGDVDEEEGLYLDEADRGSARKRRRKTAVERVRARNPKSIDIPQKDQLRRLKRQERSRVRRQADRAARRHLPALRGATSRLLALDPGSPLRARILRRISWGFPRCLVADVTRRFDAQVTTQVVPSAMVRASFHAALRCAFLEMARREGIDRKKALAWADRLEVVLMLGEFAIRIGGGLGEEEHGPDAFDGLADPLDGGSADGLDEFADETGAAGRAAAPAQVRECSRALRQAARHLLRVERRLVATTRRGG